MKRSKWTPLPAAAGREEQFVFSRKTLQMIIPTLSLKHEPKPAAAAAATTAPPAPRPDVPQSDRWWVRVSGVRDVPLGQMESALSVKRIRAAWKDDAGVAFVPAADFDDAKRIEAKCVKLWPSVLAHVVGQDALQTEGDLRSSAKVSVTATFPPLCYLLPDEATVARRNEEVYDFIADMRTE